MTDLLHSDTAGDGSTELGRALKLLRVGAGLNQVALAERTGLSQSQVSRAETDRRLLSPEEVGRVADACGAAADVRERLVELAHRLARRHVDARAILQRGAFHFQTRVRQYEEDSALIRKFQPGMVIGSMQTEAYARAIFSDPRVPAADVDRLVTERLRRGALLDDPARRWELIHTEGALTWGLGGPAVMAEQLDHLLAVSELPTVDVAVVPAFTPVDFAAHHGFAIHDADVVVVGTRSGTALLTDRADVVDYAEQFTRISQAAAHGDAARAVLTRLRDEYRSRI